MPRPHYGSGSSWLVMTKWFLGTSFIFFLGASSYYEVDICHTILLTSVSISQDRLLPNVWFSLFGRPV